MQKASEIVILHETIPLASKVACVILSVGEIHALATTFPSIFHQKSTELSRLHCPLECRSLSMSTSFTSVHVITSLWNRRGNERLYPGVMFLSLQSRARREKWPLPRDVMRRKCWLRLCEKPGGVVCVFVKGREDPRHHRQC